MAFLTPIPAIIAGTIAIPALLLFYFLKLRRRPVRVSSTFLWTQATHDLQVNVPFRMIRPSLLLLLQLLILACLLAALARPVVNMESAPAERIVILIDRSASMSARDGQGGTRLDEAKRRALAVVDSLGRSAGPIRIMVVAYAASARALTGFTGDRGAVREAIRSIEPSDQPDDLARAIDLVGPALRAENESGDESAPARRDLVVVLSDGGTPVPPGLVLDNAEWRFEGVGPPPDQPATNLGIAAISARRDYRDPATVRLFVRIVNAGSDAAAAPLILMLDGQAISRRPVEVPPATGPAPADLGEASATFEFQNSGGGVAAVAVGRADALAADDAAALVLAPVRRPGVLLVAREGEPGSWLIGDVLAEMGLSPFRSVTDAEYERMAAEGVLGPFSLIVFDGVRPARAPPIATLSFGAGLPRQSAGPAPPDADGGPARVLSWDRAHPILRDVALDAVVVARSIDLAPVAAEERGAVLVRGQRGPLMVLVEDGPVQRLFVAFQPAQSNWPLSVGFPIFLSNAVDYLTMRGEGEAGRAFTTVEPVRVRVGPDAAAEVLLRGPVAASIRTGREAGVVSAGVLERAGVYAIEGAGSGGDRAAAVNLVSPAESALRTSRELTVAGRTVASAAGAAAPREIWPWFILAAACLLAVEWFLHASMMRV